MKKKEVTIEDLAGMVQRGFVQMDNRFDGVDKRLDKIENRLDKVEDRLDSIETELIKKVDKVDHNTLDYRVEKLEKRFA